MDKGCKATTREQDGARARRLERKLKLARTPEARKELFEELTRIYAAELQAYAIRWSFYLETQNPVDDGQTALQDAFIHLLGRIPELSFHEKDLLIYYKSKIYWKLRRERTRQWTSTNRREALEEGLNFPDDRCEKTQSRLEAEEDLQSFLRGAKTDSEKTIVRALILKARGYSWTEVAREVKWPGPVESLRVLCSRYKGKSLRLSNVG